MPEPPRYHFAKDEIPDFIGECLGNHLRLPSPYPFVLTQKVPKTLAYLRFDEASRGTTTSDRGTTVIIATHDMSLLERHRAKRLHLERGRLVRREMEPA